MSLSGRCADEPFCYAHACPAFVPHFSCRARSPRAVTICPWHTRRGHNRVAHAHTIYSLTACTSRELSLGSVVMLPKFLTFLVLSSSIIHWLLWAVLIASPRIPNQLTHLFVLGHEPLLVTADVHLPITLSRTLSARCGHELSLATAITRHTFNWTHALAHGLEL